MVLPVEVSRAALFLTNREWRASFLATFSVLLTPCKRLGSLHLSRDKCCREIAYYVARFVVKCLLFS
jgi:hypothetical protein